VIGAAVNPVSIETNPPSKPILKRRQLTTLPLESSGKSLAAISVLYGNGLRSCAVYQRLEKVTLPERTILTYVPATWKAG
jgi:hypothetical protein